MKVGIFYNSISNPAKFSNKVMLMDNFAEGVKRNGDQVVDFRFTTPTVSTDFVEKSRVDVSDFGTACLWRSDVNDALNLLG
jgi:hypothetical protein